MTTTVTQTAQQAPILRLALRVDDPFEEIMGELAHLLPQVDRVFLRQTTDATERALGLFLVIRNHVEPAILQTTRLKQEDLLVLKEMMEEHIGQLAPGLDCAQLYQHEQRIRRQYVLLRGFAEDRMAHVTDQANRVNARIQKHFEWARANLLKLNQECADFDEELRQKSFERDVAHERMTTEQINRLHTLQDQLNQANTGFVKLQEKVEAQRQKALYAQRQSIKLLQGLV